MWQRGAPLAWSRWWLWLVGSLGLLLIGCQAPALSPSPAASPLPPTATALPHTQVHWQVAVPPSTPADARLNLVLLDEVSGLSVAERRFPLQAAGEGRYTVTVAVAAYQRLTYRYEWQRAEQRLPEVTVDGGRVRYRSALALPNIQIVDQVARWQDEPYDGLPPGRLQGRVTDAQTGQPVADVFVFAGGQRALTDAQGRFLLAGLPPGLHTVLFWHPDGRYRPWQQQASIAPEATTPVALSLQPSTEVTVQWRVRVPEDTIPGSPVRLIGDLYRLGNTYADLPGGQSILPTRAPQLAPAGEGWYTLTLTLPTGVPIRYKYTLGDGLTNAERTAQGLRVRHLWLDGPAQIHDQIATWRWPRAAPVWFEVSVPALPPGEGVSIQFRPLASPHWQRALPMWPLANGRWGLLFFGPMDVTQPLAYRYCRNEQCEVAAEEGVWGESGRLLRSSALPQTRQEQVSAWRGYRPDWAAPAEVIAPQSAPRSPSFVTGVAWVPAYAPHWQPYLPTALAEIGSLQAQVVVLEPTWTATAVAPYPVFGPVVGQDPLILDVQGWFQAARQSSLHLWLYPRLRLLPTTEDWWASAPLDAFPWWQAWFDRYRRFVLHWATVAQREHAAALVLGGPEVVPALPAGRLADGSASQVPSDAEERWRALIQQVRAIYPGPLWWATATAEAADLPPFSDAFAGVLVRWEPPLTTALDPAGLQEAQAERLAAWQPIAEEQGLQVVLAAAFPSARGARSGCVTGGVQATCVPVAALRPYGPLAATVPVDLAAQVDLYRALLAAVAEQPWVGGVIADEFYPPVRVQGPSASIYGKPAARWLWAWFQAWSPEEDSP